jgi:ribosome biogenesis GTPase
MSAISEAIKAIGFDRWFQDKVDPRGWNGLQLARVFAVHKDSFTINNGKRDIQAELVGKLLFNADSPLDYPTVGDWVMVRVYDDDTFSIIHQILPRRSLLKRKTPGKQIEFQLIAANVDTAFIVQSMDNNFNLRRLERYLVMANESNLKPVVLLSKSDLLPAGEIGDRIGAIRQTMPDLPVCPFSNKDKTNLEKVSKLLIPGRTYCMLGSSGVGKTTLLNNLMGSSTFSTQTVRKKDGKGRHATTHRQLVMLEGGAMLIDTPGMRELGTIAVEAGLEQTFSEIADVAEMCRFADCTHLHEDGCAILQAVENGQISGERYRHFIKIGKESKFHEMSYLEKRRKDKSFGKMCKSIMKNKKNRRSP